MATQPTGPGQAEELDDDFKRLLEEHDAAAETEPDRVSRQQLLEQGLRKLKAPAAR